MIDHLNAAREVLDQLNKGEVEAITAQFSPELKQALPADALKTQWTAVQNQLGSFKSVLDQNLQQADGMDAAGLLLQFEHAPLVFRVTYKDGAIVGLHMHPPSGAAQK